MKMKFWILPALVVIAATAIAEVAITPKVETGEVVQVNRTCALRIQSPPTVAVVDWPIEFSRQLVTTTDGKVTREEVADPINLKLGEILGRTFTRADGSVFTGAQLFNDIKLLGDTLYREKNP